MWRKAMSVLASMLPCAGCGSGQRLETQACPVPRSALECMAEPGAPEGRTDLEAALYVIDTRAAGADCRSKLQAVREALDACARGR